MSASVYRHLRNCQALPRPATARHMTFWAAIQGVVQHWRSRRQEGRTFASLDGCDLHEVGRSEWDVEFEIAMSSWHD